MHKPESVPENDTHKILVDVGIQDPRILVAQSAGAAEYTDFISAEG